MTRIQAGLFGGRLPRQAAPMPIGGSPAAIGSAYGNAFRSAQDINEALYGQILGGYQQTALGQRSAQDMIAAGYGDMGARARLRTGEQLGRNDALRERIFGDRSIGEGTSPFTNGSGRLNVLQDAFDWLQGANKESRAGYRNLYDSAMGTVRYGNDQSLAGYQSLLDQSMGAVTAANQRSAAGYGGLYDEAMRDVATLGRTEREDLRERYAQDRGRATQDAINRGFGNSSVRMSMDRRLRFDEDRANIALEDTLARQRLGVRGQFGLAREAAGERGTDRLEDVRARYGLGREQARERGIDRLENARGRFGLAEQEFLERAAERTRAQQNFIGTTRANMELQLGQMEQGIAGRGIEQELDAYGRSMQQRGNDYLANTNLSRAQLDWMNTVQAGYPNPAVYQNLAAIAAQEEAAMAARFWYTAGFG